MLYSLRERELGRRCALRAPSLMGTYGMILTDRVHENHNLASRPVPPDNLSMDRLRASVINLAHAYLTPRDAEMSLLVLEGQATGSEEGTMGRHTPACVPTTCIQDPPHGECDGVFHVQEVPWQTTDGHVRPWWTTSANSVVPAHRPDDDDTWSSTGSTPESHDVYSDWSTEEWDSEEVDCTTDDE